MPERWSPTVTPERWNPTPESDPNDGDYSWADDYINKHLDHFKTKSQDELKKFRDSNKNRKNPNIVGRPDEMMFGAGVEGEERPTPGPRTSLFGIDFPEPVNKLNRWMSDHLAAGPNANDVINMFGNPEGPALGMLGAAKAAVKTPSAIGNLADMDRLKSDNYGPHLLPEHTRVNRTALEIPEPKSGTPIYDTPQFGLAPEGKTLPAPPHETPTRDNFGNLIDPEEAWGHKGLPKQATQTLQEKVSELKAGRNPNTIPNDDPYWAAFKQYRDELAAGKADINPMNTVPNRVRPPSTNATVFDTLVPEEMKVNEQGAARPLTSAVKDPNALDGGVRQVDLGNPYSGDVGSAPPPQPKPEPVKIETPRTLLNSGKHDVTKEGVRDKFEKWVYGRGEGSRVRSMLKGQEFDDLSDPALVDAYENGTRGGRFDDVASYHEARRQELVKAGILEADQELPNYLRLEYDKDPNVAAALKQYMAENPSIAKTRQIPTHKMAAEIIEKERARLIAEGKPEAAAKLGKVKGETIPDFIRQYEAKHNRALKDKDFFDYLKETGQLEEGSKFSTDPKTWKFTGENREYLASALEDALSTQTRYGKKTADIFSKFKNIYLGGGVPGTKWNMHAFSVFNSKRKLDGTMGALKFMFTDPTGKVAAGRIGHIVKENPGLLEKLVDRGYTFSPIEDYGKEIQIFKGNNKVSRFINKVDTKYEKVMEAPLFERALPAVKLESTFDAYKRLIKGGMDEESALKEAAKIGNHFFGGENKALRNKNYNDLARIFVVAPDWLESRLKLALREYKGVGKTLTGKGTAADKIYAKSAARGVAMAGGIAGGKMAYSKYKDLDNPFDASKDNSGEVFGIPLGKDSTGRNITAHPMTTSDEGIRIPVESAIKAYQGNWTGFVDMLVKNRLSSPFKSAISLGTGIDMDNFGESMKDRDKFGKDIPFKDSLVKYLDTASKPLQMQVVQAALKWGRGEGSWEEVLAAAPELPLRFTKDRAAERPERPSREGRPRR